MEPPSPSPAKSASTADALAWYKSQYEQLESELAEFKESSLELERELEKDIEEAEKRERVLQERAEGLSFEVEEWKRKYRESKHEANTAQNTLEKEITTLRDTNRSLHLKLRDIEVANDDFERQARNTTSSLEDMESKHNMAVERAVLLEEEIKIGEKERENLRIDSQRLKEELADLRIEAELLQDKVRKHESRHHLSSISTDISVLGSPTFDNPTVSSPNSATSSPLIATPADLKSLAGETMSIPELNELTDPPSPPMSDASAPLPRSANSSHLLHNTTTTGTHMSGQPTLRKTRMQSLDQHAGPPVPPIPRPRTLTSSSRASGARSATTGSGLLRTPSAAAAPPSSSAGRTPRAVSQKVPGSNSLSHIRNLTAQMQRLEDRVHRARSKLPSLPTPPAMSPRNSIGPSGGAPTGITMVRSRTRGEGSTTSSITGDEATPTNPTVRRMPRLSTSGVGRLSFGPLPNRGPTSAGAESDFSMSRPSSRASLASSAARPESRTSMARPPSRKSFSSARVPMRPRSSLSGNLHSHSASAGVDSSRPASGPGPGPPATKDPEKEEVPAIRTPTRRGTVSSRFGTSVGPPPTVSRPPVTSIPMPGRRQSNGFARRTSSVSVANLGVLGGTPGRPASAMGLRPPSAIGRRPTEDLGETY